MILGGQQYQTSLIGIQESDLDPTQLHFQLIHISSKDLKVVFFFPYSMFQTYNPEFLLRGVFRFSEEIPNEENEINNDSLSKSSAEAKPEGSPPLLHKKVVPSSTLPSLANHEAQPIPVSSTYTHSLSASSASRKTRLSSTV